MMIDTTNGSYDDNKKTDWIEAIVPFIQWTAKAVLVGSVAALLVWLQIGFYDRLAINQLEFNKDIVQYLKDK